MVLKRGIDAPEAIPASKVRKARIDAHAGAGGDEKSVGFS
jgi:hypothetical protein